MKLLGGQVEIELSTSELSTIIYALIAELIEDFKVQHKHHRDVYKTYEEFMEKWMHNNPIKDKLTLFNKLYYIITYPKEISEKNPNGGYHMVVKGNDYDKWITVFKRVYETGKVMKDEDVRWKVDSGTKNR